MRGWKPGPVTAVEVVVAAAALVMVMMGARVECFHFHSGYSHHYTYKAVNSMLGHRNVTTVIKFNIRCLGETEDGSKAHLLHVDSLVQFMQGGQVFDNPRKLDLTKTFVFTTNATGGVTLVHVHPEDHKQLLIIKKAIVSVFSVNVQGSEGQDSWEYTTEDHDHLGRLQHDYSGKRTESGFKLHRQHTSQEGAQRAHHKTLHYDHEGTLQLAQARDHVLFKDTRGRIHTTSSTEELRQVTSSGEFPDIEAAAHISVKYNGRKPVKQGNDVQPSSVIAKLHVDSLETKRDPPKMHSLADIQQNLTRTWECIHLHYQPDSENRSICVNELRDLLRVMQADDYDKYVSDILRGNCTLQQDRQCRDDRHIVLDIAARLGDPLSQRLVVQHVLSRPSPSDEDLRRVFIHCTALESPTPDLQAAVEALCFGEQGQHVGSRRLGRSQGRACLAVGSLVKRLAARGRHEEADKLAARLETWLDLHGHGDKPLYKRDTRDALHHNSLDKTEEDEHMAKGLLLHALGNGAILRSRRHILRHAAPNAGHAIWRRAALGAMRHYSCLETAQALWNSATDDSVGTVRRMALGVLSSHPHRNTVARLQEDHLLSKKYTYPSVARVKRSVLDRVLFQFKLETPSYEWNHKLGHREVGGNFGIKFQNSIEGLFRLLSGYVDVDIHDEVHADLHMMGKLHHVELIHFIACYKGRLSYNMNIAKDFTVDLMKDINSAFDHVIRSVMAPLDRLTNSMALEFQQPESGQSISGYQPLAQAVAELPKQTERARNAAGQLKEAADPLGILPHAVKLQDVIKRAQSLLEDVHSEASDLFTAIDEESRIALPFGEKEIKGAINSVLGVIDKVKDYPNQAFSTIETAKMRYQLAMMRILEASKIIKQAFAFISGGRSSWNNAREELSSLKDQTKALVEQLKADFQRRKRRDTATRDTFGPCASVEVGGALVKLYNSSDGLVRELDVVLNHSPQRLQEALKLMAVQTQTLKAGFSSFREALDMVKSRVQALFGMKFHHSFPNIRRDCDNTCGCGYYPTDCTRYGHPGVDLVWQKGWRVPSPVTGIAYLDGSNAVRLVPKTADLGEYVIYIGNIGPTANLTKQKEMFVESGQELGVSLGASGCNRGHIHLAMRRTSNQTGLCHYVNPTSFLDNFNPKITWQQECNEFAFRHALQTTDFSSLTDGFKPLLEELKRYALDSLSDRAIKKLNELVPDGSFLAPFRDIGVDFFNHYNVSRSASDLKDLFDEKVNAGKEFLDKLKPKDFSFKKLLDLAEVKESLKSKLPNLKKLAEDLKDRLKFPTSFKGLGDLNMGSLSRIAKKLSDLDLDLSLPSLNLGDFSLASFRDDLFGGLRNLLDFKGGVAGAGKLGSFFNMTRLLDKLAAGKDKLVAKLKQKLKEKACPGLIKLLKKQGSPCIPHDDCRGLTCDVTFSSKHLTGAFTVDIRLDRLKRLLHIAIDGKNHTIEGNADSKTLPTALKLFGSFDVKLKLWTTWSGDDLWFSLQLQACGPNLCCLPQINLARNLSLTQFSVSSLWNSFNASDVDFEILPLDRMLQVSTDLDVQSDELTNSMLGIQDLIEQELNVSLPASTRFSTEFHNPQDLVDGGSYPLDGQESEIYAEFFVYTVPIPLGPAVLIGRFSSGGAVGFEFRVDVKSADSHVKSTFTPWVAARMMAGVSIDIWVFAIGVDLHAWVMRTRFPMSLTTHFTKQPVLQTKQLDMELIPLEFKVVAWFEIKIMIRIKIGWVKINIVLFYKRWSKTLWHWRARGHRGRVWKKESRKDDLGPPRFPYCDRVDQQCLVAAPSRPERATTSTPTPGMCLVRQLPARHPRQAAVRLDFSVEDEDSDVSITYAVGDYPGGTNVRGWQPMRGNILVLPEELPCGKPLYFHVRAVNSQGLGTTASCTLPTYDCSLPDGRVDMASQCTSHRDSLAASVVLYEDSPLKQDQLFYSVGYSPGPYGHELTGWAPLQLDTTESRAGVAGSLRHFTSPRPGRLERTPVRSFLSKATHTCADACLAMHTCVSFSYNTHTFTCELQEVTEGVHAGRVMAEHYMTYEKLGKGYSATLRLQDLALRHGARYYVNSWVENVLDYRSVLTSHGTMVDHTSPEPGPLGDGAVEVKEEREGSRRCNASIIQRCEEPSPNLPHRKFIDGTGGSTVFNGNRRGQELHFTMDNHHASANWDGFKDEECGIHGYTWAVGTNTCGSDVSPFVDPHSHLTQKADWPHVGLAKHLELAEGRYYVTVQATNDIQRGGDLVTTVCHSTPFVVDITPPVLQSVNQLVFDDGFHLLAVYFTATDGLSGVQRLEMGLGRTKYDVMLRGYQPLPIRGRGEQTYVLNEEFHMVSGVAAWVRLKVVDKVGLWVTGHGSRPVLLDSTGPLAGQVMDGRDVGEDACCQTDHTTICAHWLHFEDPESHIDRYEWGVGSTPGRDDVVPFRSLPNSLRHLCVSGLWLQHNTSYFSTVVAYNKALNQKSVNATSTGVLVDVTPPVAGIVVDGTDVNNDVNFTSESSSVSAAWTGFSDPETDIASYTVQLYVNDQMRRTFPDLQEQQLIHNSAALAHGDRVHVTVTALNRGGGRTSVTSDGQTVDQTPPEVVQLGTVEGTPFQRDDTSLDFVWHFQDPESGVSQYRYAVLQRYQGVETHFWPVGSLHQVTELNGTAANSTQQLRLTGLSLVNGAAYSVRVTALNRAKMTTAERSTPVTVDITPPVLDKVRLCLPGDDEEINENGQVEHIEGEPLHVSWTAYDRESGLSAGYLCIGLAGSNCLESGDVISLDSSSLLSQTVTMDSSHLQVWREERPVVYEVQVVVVNGAGVRSPVLTSTQMFVVKGNVAGVVLDGRSDTDQDFTNDRSGLAVTFSGFSSEACGIERYDWGLGTAPCATDLLPFSQDGLVTIPHMPGAGRAQASVAVTDGTTYYAVVRAWTGHSCHEPVIVSCSDGITVDSTPPSVSVFTPDDVVSNVGALTSHDVVYQTTDNTLELGWFVDDPTGVNATRLTIDRLGSAAYTSDVATISKEPFPLSFALSSGDTAYTSLRAVDNAGNAGSVDLPAVTFDATPPAIDNFFCVDVISARVPTIYCTWSSVSDIDSGVQELQFGLGSEPTVPDLLNMTSVQVHQGHWSYDVSSMLDSQLAKVSEVYVLVSASNRAKLETKTSVRVTKDTTPPQVDDVIVVTSTGGSRVRRKQKCQTSREMLEVQLVGARDDESNIDSVLFALGTAKGTSDIHHFQPYEKVDGVYVRGHLRLPIGSVIYVTARVTNGVGLYTVVTSEAVVISPEPRLEVTDGPDQTDVDVQTDLYMIQGRWKLTDPCPVTSVQWAVTELGRGRQVRPFTDATGGAHVLYDDTLMLHALKVYLIEVKVKDALGRQWQARSDGVLVSVGTPAVAAVWEGHGERDMDFQTSVSEVVASWDHFGDSRSALPTDQIVRYEVALGTDLTEEETRTNIHGFVDVGLATTYTFHDLNLTAVTTTYYVTVRAYSAAGSFSEGSSDGIKAGFSGKIKKGEVDLDPYQSDTASIRVSWSGFTSDVGDLQYYVGISTASPEWSYWTEDCSDAMNTSVVFDAFPLQAVEAEATVTLEELQLDHNQKYYVSVVAEDAMSHCSGAVGGPVLVDTTPPMVGQVVVVDGYDAGSTLFVHSTESLTVRLDNMTDPESGVKMISVQLAESVDCGMTSTGDIIQTIIAEEEQEVTLPELSLRHDAIYVIKINVSNGARLQTNVVSKPLLVAVRAPSPGSVRLGSHWRGEDAKYQGQGSRVDGVVAVHPAPSPSSCRTEHDHLSSQPGKGNWTTVRGQFSSRSVSMENGRLSLALQHNLHLTAMDRAAAQLVNLTLAQGSYSVLMTPAAGDHVLTGFSMASPRLQPPFLAQNQALLNSSDCVDGTCGQNDTDGDSKIGFGLSFVQLGRGQDVLFWVQDQSQLKEIFLDVDFDPFTTPVEYGFRLTRTGESQWEVAVVVDGQAQQAVSGLTLPPALTLTLYTWNVDDFFPPVTDPFRPYRTVATVTAVVTPVADRPLCSYGAAFRDERNGIQEVWAGLSDSLNHTANVAPYRLVKRFCTPCLRDCTNLCLESCRVNTSSLEFQTIPVALTNLTLESASEALKRTVRANASVTGNDTDSNPGSEIMDDFHLPMYYLDVKVVAHSGLVAESKSAALIVDTTGPVVKRLNVTDPSYSADEPVEFVGTVDSVGGQWDLVEDVSAVTGQWLALGTSPGQDDVVPWQQLDRKAIAHTVTDLSDVLRDQTAYHLSLKVINAAGVTTIATSPFSVNVMPPPVSDVRPGVDNVTEHLSVSGESVAFVERADTLGVQLPTLDSRAASVKFWAWSIGSQPGQSDILPEVIVGNPNVSHIAIVDGHVVIDGTSTNVTVGDYARSNFRQSNGTGEEGSLFALEPGRCLRQQVHAISNAHKETALDLEPVCIRRSSDVMAQTGTTDIPLKVNEKDGLQLHLPVKSGALTAGPLTTDDVNMVYGTAASSEFSPFIVSPDPDRPVSRSLKGRLWSTEEPYFYLSPVAGLQLGDDVGLAYSVPPSVEMPAGFDVTLLFWAAETKEWVSLRDVCLLSQQKYDRDTRNLTARVCMEAFITQDHSNKTRVARSTTASELLQPRMFTLAVVDPTPVNLPPVLDPVTLTLLEGQEASVSLRYQDSEDDVVFFSLLEEPHSGTVTVTSEGHVTYRARQNFAGDDVFVVGGREVLDEASVAAGVVANIVNISVPVVVTNVNDAPNLSFLPAEKTSDAIEELSTNESGPNGTLVTVLIEGNTTTSIPLGLLYFTDLDPDDNLVLLNHTMNNVNATLTMTRVEPDDPRLGQLSASALPPSSQVRDINLEMSASYHGNVRLDARVKDASDTYSVLLTLDVHVMISPCQHGDCQARHPGQSCTAPERAQSFRSFRCHCRPGYEGKWCETETNECENNECSALADCVDLLAHYRCDINVYKTTAVVCSVLLVVIVAAVLLWLFRAKVFPCCSRSKQQKPFITDEGDNTSSSRSSSHSSGRDSGTDVATRPSVTQIGYSQLTAESSEAASVQTELSSTDHSATVEIPPPDYDVEDSQATPGQVTTPVTPLPPDSPSVQEGHDLIELTSVPANEKSAF